MRINKFLAQVGVASRRKVDQLIEEGRIIVNGKRAILGQKVTEKDEILVDGKKAGEGVKKIYIIVNKPKGITSTAYDRHARRSVLQLVGAKERLFPVGRLDQDSTGLMILTNDGEITQRVTHPKYHIPKTYEALILGAVETDKIKRMEQGIELEEGTTAPAQIETIFKTAHRTFLKITLFEGKKRQIRRMAAEMHLHILTLKRISIGPIKLGSLASGKYRHLTENEIKLLIKSAKLVD